MKIISILDHLPEVEEVIERQVQAVLEESPSTLENRIILVDKLIDALENDASWVELYGITGELVVPDAHDENDEIQELLLRATKVDFQLDYYICAS